MRGKYDYKLGWTINTSGIIWYVEKSKKPKWKEIYSKENFYLVADVDNSLTKCLYSIIWFRREIFKIWFYKSNIVFLGE